MEAKALKQRILAGAAVLAGFMFSAPPAPAGELVDYYVESPGFVMEGVVQKVHPQLRMRDNDHLQHWISARMAGWARRHGGSRVWWLDSRIFELAAS